MNQPYIHYLEFDTENMLVRVQVVGHPTESLKLAREAIGVILSGHGAWCITAMTGDMPKEASYPSEFSLNVVGTRME